MKARTQDLAAWAVAVVLVAVGRAQPVGTAFTFQGNLKDVGQPANGLHDMRFQLFKSVSGGSQIGPTVCLDGVTVAQGSFMVALDFGSVFDGDQRFLQVSVRKDSTVGNCASGTFTTLSPRQPLMPVPYALKVPGIDGHSLDASDGSPVDALFVDAAGNVGIGTTAPTQRLQVAGTVRSTSGGFMFPDGTTQTTAAAGGSGYWSANGTHIYKNNAGNVGIGNTSPGFRLDVLAAGFDGDGVRVSGAAGRSPGFVVDGPSGRGFLGQAETIYGWSGNAAPGDVVLGADQGKLLLQTGTGAADIAIVGNNVGIGTASPAASLDVRGNIRLGSAGEQFATGGTENLRLLRGNIDGNGTTDAGSGFTSSRITEGAYTITFNTPFTSMPSVTVTCHDPVAGSNFRFASIIRVDPGYFQIYVKNLSGDSTNSDFSFCVIGPR